VAGYTVRQAAIFHRAIVRAEARTLQSQITAVRAGAWGDEKALTDLSRRLEKAGRG